MRRLIWLLIAVLGCLVSCNQASKHHQILSDAERFLSSNPDSAIAVLSAIDAADIGEDSLKAKYHIVLAGAHKFKECSMASDSLLGFAFEYYKNRDITEFVLSGELLALHKFWIGNGGEALRLLDSLVEIPQVPDYQRIQLLKSRIAIGGAEFDCERNINMIRRLLTLDTDSAAQPYYKYQLCENYQYAGQGDSALLLIDELINHARTNRLGDDSFQYTYEKVGILEELGRYDESNATVDYILENAPHSSAIPYLHYWKALNYFNMGNHERASVELALADSCAAERADVDIDYYESFAGHLRALFDFKRDGVITLKQLATLNNTQRDKLYRMESIRWATEQTALQSENRALALKNQNERKTAIIIIVALTALLIAFGAVWNIQKRKRRIMEAEERAEALEKMVEELRVPALPSSEKDTLRKAMLKQLGIIKMVAETPTEQNRELLRKISSIDADTNGSLVNWNNVYEIIDNLYSEFYTRLHQKFGNVLSEKEEQIIVLMMAGFSTKEISVITSQTTATIYVRKSSIRKKLGVPEKEDIVAFLNQ